MSNILLLRFAKSKQSADASNGGFSPARPIVDAPLSPERRQSRLPDLSSVDRSRKRRWEGIGETVAGQKGAQEGSKDK